MHPTHCCGYTCVRSNTATVTGTPVDDLGGNGTDKTSTDGSSFTVQAPTMLKLSPGFWAQRSEFWDGATYAGNQNSGVNLPKVDAMCMYAAAGVSTYQSYCPGSTKLGSATPLILGDFNLNVSMPPFKHNVMQCKWND